MTSQTPPVAGAELLPCPFCGGENVKAHRCEHARDPSGDFDMIGCMDCGAGLIDGTPDDWNRRASPSAPAGEALAPFAHLRAAGKLPAGRTTVHLTSLDGQWLATLDTEDFWRARQALAATEKKND